MKKVLSIAGSDCSGGAGIQADLKTFSAHGVFGMSVIVSVVAENTSRVIDIQDITPDMIEKQIDAVFEDIEVDAVKIGMLSTPECMKAVAKKLLQYKPQNVVIDPVMYAKNGCPLMNPTAVSTLIDTVIPLADVLTPNIPEAEKIADMQISTVSDISFVIWLAFVVVLVCAIDLLMARFITKPVSELNEAARNMAELNFSHPCHVESHDEFGELAESLNKMAENLQQAFSSLEGANRKLEQDVEQKKRLLAERKELVDNLSHEMKTPLGVIRAYAEGLQDETDEAKRQKYSEVIITETERMSRLITTLLDLSALENGATQLRPERFDFVDFLETVAGRLLIDTPDADFVLEYELPEHPVYVNTDKGRMEQVLNNLIVNAKRNNRPGGILRLSLLEKDGLLNFSIFNQGAPIPEESLSKIWSKFYRDKNSKYSGSGLGLAIVAQVLSMQHLHYGAENQPGGVAFYFSLPTVK